MISCKIKVCGITNEANYNDLKNYPVDYFGFIFYDKSPRYLLKYDNIEFIKSINNKVGVFIDDDITNVIGLCEKYNFKTIQLHGNEDPNYCYKLKDNGIKIIKTFLINSSDDLKNINLFNESVDYFLFDYKSRYYGGSGKNFDWRVLNNVEIFQPFFLSGGISLDNIDNLNIIKNKSNLYAIDINSNFETFPGFKNIDLIDKLFNKLDL